MATAGIDLAAMLRGLRRRADLSQRELAARAGVPQASVARIESGRADNPSFRTIERLVEAAGAALIVTEVTELVKMTEGGRQRQGPVVSPVEPIPHEALRDRGGRHYPAHLDIEEVTRPEKWWGSWWTLTMVRERWPLEQLPPYTFDRARPARDQRRERRARGQLATVRRVPLPGPGDVDLLWLAEVEQGGRPVRVGELRAHRESRGEVLIDGLVVAEGWRGCGIGRRLLTALRAEVDRPITAAAREFAYREFLEACGFRPAGVDSVRMVG